MQPSALVLHVLLRWHRVCIRAYPVWFREAHAAGMIATFEDLLTLNDGKLRPAAMVRLAAAEFASLISGGLRARLRGPGSELAGPRWRWAPARAITFRERNRMYLMSHFRYAVRSLVRTPGYVLAFVLTLGLGIGANTAIFSVINGVLLQPLPYPDADRIMYVKQVATSGGTSNSDFSFLEVSDYREQATVFDEVVEFGDWTFNVLGRGEPHLATGGLVTSNFFDVLGLRPILGRMLVPEDKSQDATPVAVLTHEYWSRIFGADSSVIGQTLDLTVKRATIVGVLEPGSHYTAFRRRQDFYVNYSANDHYMGAAMQDQRTHRMTSVFARLAPDATVEMARTQVRDIASRLYGEFPEAYPESRGYEVRVTPWLEELTAQARPTLFILFGTAAFVLLIAAANVANLTLTRLIRRERELAIRAALGAPRARLRGQLLAENLLLSLTGATLGLVLAVTGLDLLVAYTARFTPRTGEIGIDLFVLAFTLVIAVGAAMLFAWAPSLPVADDLGTSLTAAGGGRATGAVTRRRAQRALVVSQVAISFVLLVGAGLLVRSLWKLSQVDPGFDTENVLSMGVPDFSQQGGGQILEFGQSLVNRVSGHAGVHGAAMAQGAPLGGNLFTTQMRFRVEGQPEDPNPVTPMTTQQVASASYFETVGTPIVRGRAFRESDQADSIPEVVILNQSMADFYFRDQDPIGRRISRFLFGDRWTSWYTVIGIAADAKETGLDHEPTHTYYLPTTQRSVGQTLLVRTAGAALPMAGQVMEEVRALDRNRPIVNVQTLEDLRSDQMAPQRLNATLFLVFAVLALVIATVGIAGVLSFSVSQRTNEFGIRMTLGADQRRVLKMVLGEGAALALIGLAVGGVGALALSQFLSGLLFEIQPTDPITFFGVAGVLAVIAVAASLVPARLATGVDPMHALRSD